MQMVGTRNRRPDLTADLAAGGTPRIISRTVVRRPLTPATGWSRDRVLQGHVQLEYDVRLECDPDPASRGADCSTEGTVRDGV